MHKGGIGHVAHQHLHTQVFGPPWLLLVGTALLGQVFPLLLAFTVDFVLLHDVGHDIFYGLVDTGLAARLPCHGDTHEGGLFFRAVNKTEFHVVQMYAQRRKHGIGHGRAAHLGHVLGEQGYQRRQSGRHLWRTVALGIISGTATLHPVSCLLDGPLHHLGHHLVLRPLARTLYGAQPLIPCLSVGGQHPAYPQRVVVAHIAQMGSHGKNEAVARTMRRHTAHLFAEALHQQVVGDAVVIVGIGVVLFVLLGQRWYGLWQAVRLRCVRRLLRFRGRHLLHIGYGCVRLQVVLSE